MDPLILDGILHQITIQPATRAGCLSSCEANYSVSMTSRFRYDPQFGQTRCGSFTPPQVEQVERPGVAIFQFAERRERTFMRPVFLLGTAMSPTFLPGANGEFTAVH